MMQKYELVIVAQAALTKDELNTIIKNVEDTFEGSVKAIDDMGVMKLSHKTTKIQNSHLLSFYLEIDWLDVNAKKQNLKYTKWIEKIFVFKMSKNQPFYTYAELEKQFDEVFPKEQLNSKFKI